MTAEPTTFAVTLKSVGEAIAAMWARGALLLWCLTTACFVILLALIAGAHFHIGDAATLLESYGTLLGLAFLALLVFAGFKTYDERARPILSLIPNEAQSFWGQTRHSDGRIFTQLTLRFQATNFSKGAIMLSDVCLKRPWVGRRSIRTKMVSVQHPNRNENSSKNPILPNSLTYGDVHITIDHPVGKVGKPMRVVIALQDHARTWHKLAFPHLPTIGTPG